MSHSHPHKPSADDRYEATDASVGGIFKYGLWLALFTGISLVAMYGLLRGVQEIDFHAGSERHALAPALEIPPEPRLEALRLNAADYEQQLTLDDPDNPGHKLTPFTTSLFRDYRVRTKAQLETYGWVDERAKVARIPIERAIEIQLKKGYPTASKAKTN